MGHLEKCMCQMVQKRSLGRTLIIYNVIIDRNYTCIIYDMISKENISIKSIFDIQGIVLGASGADIGPIPNWVHTFLHCYQSTCV